MLMTEQHKNTFKKKIHDGDDWIHLTKNNIQWPSRLSGSKTAESALARRSFDQLTGHGQNDLQVPHTVVLYFDKYDSQQRIHQHVSLTKLLIRQHNAMKHLSSRSRRCAQEQERLCICPCTCRVPRG